MLKYKLINNKTHNIVIPIQNDIDYLNNTTFSEEIFNITPEFIDNEIKKYTLANNINLVFGFFNNNIYQDEFTNAGFDINEINLSNRNYRFSYILMQVFDSIDFKSQNLLHSSYIPIYLFPSKNNTNFPINPNTKYYEFSNLYISNNTTLVNNQSLYANFKFYNAKTGKLIIMFNQSITSNNQDRFYFEIKINKTNNTYTFTNSNVNAREFVNEEYTNKINQLNKSENKVPLYPDGQLFDVNGNYIILP
jgi:hypothetical protein